DAGWGHGAMPMPVPRRFGFERRYLYECAGFLFDPQMVEMPGQQDVGVADGLPAHGLALPPFLVAVAGAAELVAVGHADDGAAHVEGDGQLVPRGGDAGDVLVVAGELERVPHGGDRVDRPRVAVGVDGPVGFVVVAGDPDHHQLLGQRRERLHLFDQQATVQPHLLGQRQGGAPGVGAALRHEPLDAVTEVDEVHGADGLTFADFAEPFHGGVGGGVEPVYGALDAVTIDLPELQVAE